MYRGLRVVVVIPAGRRRYLEVLLPQLASFDVVDEVRLWLNTANAGDRAYIAGATAGDKTVVVDELPLGVAPRGVHTIHHFHTRCVDPGTVYVRLSDDVVLLDTPDALAAFLDFRIDHPELFLVCGNVLNTAITTHIQQRAMLLDVLRGVSGYTHADRVGHGCHIFAENVHFHILSRVKNRGDLRAYRLHHPWLLYYHEHATLDCVAWMGADFAAFEGKVPAHEAQFLMTAKPRALNRMNCIFGGFVCVHFATQKQRDHLDWTGMLDAYAGAVGLPAGLPVQLPAGLPPAG